MVQLPGWRNDLKIPYILAIDFDGTVCDAEFPGIGAIAPGFMDAHLLFRRLGVKQIMWTCREGGHLLRAVHWSQDRGIQWDAINEELPELREYWGRSARKPYADLYIDDRSWVGNHTLYTGEHGPAGMPDWSSISTFVQDQVRSFNERHSTGS